MEAVMMLDTLMVWNLTSMLFCSLLKVELSLAAHSSLSRRQTRRTVEFSLKVMYSRILMSSSAGSSTRASCRWPGPPRPPGHRVWGAGGQVRDVRDVMDVRDVRDVMVRRGEVREVRVKRVRVQELQGNSWAPRAKAEAGGG